MMSLDESAAVEAYSIHAMALLYAVSLAKSDADISQLTDDASDSLSDALAIIEKHRE